MTEKLTEDLTLQDLQTADDLDTDQTVSPDNEAINGSETMPQNDLEETVLENQQKLDKLERWKRDLLDISLRNPLINYRKSKAGIPLKVFDTTALVDAFYNSASLALIHEQKEGDTAQQTEKILQDFDAKKLTVPLTENDLSKRLTDMFRKARLTQEECGANPLFVSIGFLRWQEKDKPNVDRFSPILLIPIELTRKSARAGYTVQMTGDEATINLSLVEMLRVNFKIDISALTTLPTTDGSPDIGKILNFLRDKISAESGWQIEDDVHIGMFTYSSFVLWNDLVVREPQIREHIVTGSMISGVNDKRLYEPAFEPSPDPNLYLSVDADSSQMLAAKDAAMGKTFVLFGPPGTGKSQTITNIIANALAHGKRVLFVAEKIAALNVVKKRLSKLGLWDFCLELHGNKGQKRAFYEQFDKVVELAEQARDVGFNEQASKLEATEGEVQLFSDAMNRQQKIGCSVRQAIDNFFAVDFEDDLLEISHTDISREELQAAQEALKNLADIGAALGEPRNSPFYSSTVTEYTFALRDEVLTLSKAITDNFENFSLAKESLVAAINNPKRPQEFLDYDSLQKLFVTLDSALHYHKNPRFKNFFAYIFSDRHKQMRKCGFYKRLKQFIKKDTFEAEGILSAFKEFLTPEIRLNEILGYSDTYKAMSDFALEIFSAAEGFKAGIATLKDHSIYNKMIESAKAQPVLQETVEAYHNGELTSDQLASAFEKSFWQNYLVDVVSADEVLNSFSLSTHTTKQERFKAFSAHVTDICKKEIFLKMASRLPNFKYASMSSSEPGILMRAIKNRGRGITIRSLFDKIPVLMAAVKPCMLMSPLSAAQYLSADFPLFDMVVFDEASQLITSEAVGAVSRGKAAIVVGDPKQLPPTTFFRTQQEDFDTEFDLLDMESILDDLLTLNLPQRKLAWHYRSEHESLISFSNVNFYDGSLITFPSPDEQNSRVSFQKVEGIYDRGKTRTNINEAEAIVEDLFARLADPEKSKLTYGIVTFNITQQDLIEDLVDKRLAKNPEFEVFFTGDDAVFIKNIESVQGDERDVIFFSVTYGEDKDGKMTANFGPINKSGGWRRLNVAITRAIKEIVVYSTIMPDKIDTQKSTALGVTALKEFLHYSINPEMYFMRFKKVGDTALINSICTVLNARGYNAVANVGKSDNKVDVAVLGDNGKFSLGILCDNDKACSQSARDREYTRVEFFKKMGWKIAQVFALEWWQNKEAEIKRLEQLLHGNEDCASQIDSIAEELKSEEIALNPNIPLPKAPYIAANLGQKRQPEGFYMYSNVAAVMKQIAQIVEEEAPISEQMLKRKLAAKWSASRMTQKFSAYTDLLLSRAGIVCNTTQNTKFFWARPEQVDMKEFRANEKICRKIEDISKEELSVAAHFIMQNALSINRDDLVRETARMFCLTKTPAVALRINAAINFLVQKGCILCDEESVKIIG